MMPIAKSQPRREFAVPPGIVFAYVDRKTGRLADNQNPNRVRVAFRTDSVPSRDGTNLARIGEPGARVMSTVEDPGGSGAVQAIPADEPENETDDYLRQGYED